MPEYLAPGVVVEEVSFRSRSIEGVSTSTTGFVGPTRFGPLRGEPPLLTSFSDFERIYGGLDPLFLSNSRSHNYLAHAVRAYFEEGGRRLYVSRVFEAISDTNDGIATATVNDLRFRARYPGRFGNFTAQFVFRTGDNILRNPRGPLNASPGPSPAPDPADNRLVGARDQDVVLARHVSVSPAEFIARVERFFDATVGRESFRLHAAPLGSPAAFSPPVVNLADVDDVRVITVSVLVQPPGRFADELVWPDLTFSAQHRDESLGTLLAAEPPRRSTELYVPLVLESGGGPISEDGERVAEALLSQGNRAGDGTIFQSLLDPDADDDHRTLQVDLTDGNDGNIPDAGVYEGIDGTEKSGLRAFEDIEEISIVAAPGSTFAGFESDAPSDPIRRALINHCERMRYRVAILDSQDGQILADIQDTRGSLDSTRAALYYPWVRIFDPVTEEEILQPPSGYLAGIFARNDVERGVHKTPANEVVRSAIGFEFLLNQAQQEVLNPRGINCLRYFEGRGFRVWGGRTISSDPEWKYLNVRRYFAFLERSIERGTQWAVFENNGPILWDNVRQTIEGFLFNEWRENHLLGTNPEQAYFVRCDRTTISQNDLDNGRLICLIGVAALKPAEFVIFRIGQKTADSP